MKTNKTLSDSHQQALLDTLQKRFEQNMQRHKGLHWPDIQAKLEAHPEKLWTLDLMEETEGEPDVVGYDKKTGAYLFFDCSPESPQGRRSICYDRVALETRKKHKPKHSAIGMAEEMGISILTEQQYRELQDLGAFDCKTSSWILTPEPIKKLGGALFCDRRFDHIFTYHNGAESYYAARGFRGALKV